MKIPPRLSGLSSLIIVIAGATLHSIGIARASDDSPQPTSVKLSIRTIQASEPRDISPDQGATTQTQLDPTLGDIGAKLSRLPFAKFHLLAAKEETITLRKRNSIKLPNGQSLAFRPMSTENKKMGLWLNWKDSDGSEILNTRVHFDADDSVVTGTDCAHDKGLILAIKAEAIAPSPGE